MFASIRTFLAIALAACSPPPDRLPPDVPGPYAVGTVTLDLADGRYTRPLRVQVWYPAVDPGTPTDFYEEIAVQSGAHRDAEPDRRGAPYPVVAFSHGFGGIRYQSAFLTEHLASHGFVVVSADHQRNTMMDLDKDATGAVLVNRPLDVTHAVDGALAEPFLHRMMESDRFAMTGHSFGGLTTLVVTGGTFDFDYGAAYCVDHDVAGCAFFEDTELGDASLAVPDPRAVVGVDLSPAGWYAFGEHGLDDIAPILAIGGDRDVDLPWDSEAQPTMERLPTPKTLVTLAGVGHWGVTDLCEVVPFFDDCLGAGEGFMEIERVHAVTNTLVTAFVTAALVDDADVGAFLTPAYWDADVMVEVFP